MAHCECPVEAALSPPHPYPLPEEGPHNHICIVGVDFTAIQ